MVEALLLGKNADAAERGIELRIEGGLPHATLPARDLVTVLGNLVDNAFDALVPADVRRVVAALGGDPVAVVVTVEDSGPGLDDDAAAHALERGWTTKGSARGAAASAWPWSPRSSAGTGATSRSAAPTSAGHGSR